MRNHQKPIVVSLWIVGFAAASVVTMTAVHTERQAVPPQNTAPVSDGRELFNTYCASCHGVTGTGNGPAAASMRRSPPDLTGLASANGGVFPMDRLGRIIDGRDVESHGDRDMPVWGDAFKSLRGGHSEDVVRARIGAILKYLASLQRRQA